MNTISVQHGNHHATHGHSEFKDMNAEERREFLNMDLVYHMIRVEQRIDKSQHKTVGYKDTEYYKNLNSEQRHEFSNYIKTRGRKGLWRAAAIVAPLGCLLALNSGALNSGFTEFSGNVMSAPTTASPLADVVLVAVLVAGVAAYALHWERHHRLGRHSQVLEDIYRKRVVE